MPALAGTTSAGCANFPPEKRGQGFALFGVTVVVLWRSFLPPAGTAESDDSVLAIAFRSERALRLQ